jgi:hypothetical protein
MGYPKFKRYLYNLGGELLGEGLEVQIVTLWTVGDLFHRSEHKRVFIVQAKRSCSHENVADVSTLSAGLGIQSKQIEQFFDMVTSENRILCDEVLSQIALFLLLQLLLSGDGHL